MFKTNKKQCLENTQVLQTNKTGNQIEKKQAKDVNRYWEKVFVVFKTNKGLMLRIYKGFLQINKTGK